MTASVSIHIGDGVADVRLSRPEKMNGLNQALLDGLIAAAERLAQEPGLRVVVLSGEGGAFCAGLDFTSFAGLNVGDIETRTHGMFNLWQAAVMLWRQLPVPVVAAVTGVAFGAGFQIALAADMRFLAPDARMSIMEIKWGLVPDMGGFALMRTLARDDVIRDLTYSGRIFSAEEALAYGLATRIVDDPRSVALIYAREKIAKQSPDAVRAAKRLINLTTFEGAATLLEAESLEQSVLIGSPNQTEAVSANFAKREPRFKDVKA